MNEEKQAITKIAIQSHVACDVSRTVQYRNITKSCIFVINTLEITISVTACHHDEDREQLGVLNNALRYLSSESVQNSIILQLEYVAKVYLGFCV